jgi:hypothetical protein
LIDHKTDFEGALERYLKGHCFEKAVKLCMQSDQSALVQSQVKPVVLVACDLVRTRLITLLETFGKRYLRLKTVQHTKRAMPEERAAGTRDFELDSDNLSQASES